MVAHLHYQLSRISVKPFVLQCFFGSSFVIAVFHFVSWCTASLALALWQRPFQSTGGVSAVSDFAEDWKQDAYVGYSICCKIATEMKRVLQAIAENSNPRDTTMAFTEPTNFILGNRRRV